MGLYIICDLPHIIPTGGQSRWPVNYRDIETMENLNFDNDAIVDPKDAEIERLTIANDLKAQQLDQFGDAIMGVIGDKVEALSESIADRIVERALDDFDISNFEYEIGDMIDERLPEGLDDESRSDDLKAAIKEVLSGATLTMDIE
jgi:hypothetical protein